MKKKIIIKKGDIISPKEYIKFLEHIKTNIQQAQLRAASSITKELTLLYWQIGKELTAKTESDGWGTKVIEKLAVDLGKAFPGITGFSHRNIFRMQAFFLAYEKVPQAVAEIKNLPIFNIPWGHNSVLIEKVKNTKERLWYAEQTIKNGWSRAVLSMWIESELYSRQGKAVTNFKATLPNPDSDLATQILKDPYNFDFLTMDEKAREREIEKGLMTHIQKFLLELGQGFAFIGRQYPIKVGEKDFFIDMLFYHIDLRCFIVIELKAEEFAITNVGQINFYLSAVDSLLKREGDKPTIGLLLCKSKDNYVAEYALRDVNKPIGISIYQTKLVESLPKEFKSKLPSIAEIEAELEKSELQKNIKSKPEKTKAVKKNITKTVNKAKITKKTKNPKETNIIKKITKLIKDSKIITKHKKYTKN